MSFKAWQLFPCPPEVSRVSYVRNIHVQLLSTPGPINNFGAMECVSNSQSSVNTVMLVSHSSVSPSRSMFWTYAGSLWWTISSALWSRLFVCRANSWKGYGWRDRSDTTGPLETEPPDGPSRRYDQDHYTRLKYTTDHEATWYVFLMSHYIHKILKYVSKAHLDCRFMSWTLSFRTSEFRVF